MDDEFLAETEQSIRERASTAGYLPADEEQAMAILTALEHLGEPEGGQCLERVFSLRCFKDSKYFEKKVRSRLAGIIKKYYLKQELPDEMSDDDVLMQVGLLQSPELIDFRGGICGTVGGRKVDFRHLSMGFPKRRYDKGFDNRRDGQCPQNSFIENKANYIHFLAGTMTTH